MDSSWNQERLENILRKSEKLCERKMRLNPKHREFPPLAAADSFKIPIPGYQGFQPMPAGSLQRRLVAVNPESSLELYSTCTNSWRNWSSIRIKPGESEIFGRPRDANVDYRVQCHRYTHKCSPFVADLSLPPPPMGFNMQLSKHQYGF